MAKNRKKMLVKILAAVVLLGVIGLVVLALSFNSLVRGAVVTVGPQVTKSSFALEKFSLSPFSGRGEIRGLVIGNPEGFKTPSAFELGSVKIKLQPGSLFSDCIVIDEIFVDAPVVTYEQGLTGTNIGALLKNVEAFTGGPAQPEPKEEKPAADKPGKKILIKRFVVEGAKVRFSAVIMGGAAATVPMARVELTDIGKETEGASVQETVKKIANAIGGAIMNTVAGAGDLAKKGLESVGNAAGSAVGGVKDGVGKAAGAVKGLFGGDKK